MRARVFTSRPPRPSAHRGTRRRAAVAVHAALVALCALAALAATSNAARADAVMPPPDDCARGSTGTTSHTDTYCMPSACTTSIDCNAPSDLGTERELACTPSVGLCIETRSAIPGGRFPAGIVPGRVSYDVAHGACTTDADCAAPAHCVATSRCTARTTTEFVTRALGCTAPRAGALPRDGADLTALSSAALGVLVVARLARRHRGT